MKITSDKKGQINRYLTEGVPVPSSPIGVGGTLSTSKKSIDSIISPKSSNPIQLENFLKGRYNENNF